MDEIDAILAEHEAKKIAPKANDIDAILNKMGGNVSPNRSEMAIQGALSAFPGANIVRSVSRDGGAIENTSAGAQDVANLATILATGGLGRMAGALGTGIVGGAALGSISDKVKAANEAIEGKLGVPYDYIETNLPSKVAGVNNLGELINVATRVPRVGMETTVEALPAAVLTALGINPKGSRMVPVKKGMEGNVIAELASEKFGAPVPKITGTGKGEILDALNVGRSKLGGDVGAAKKAMVQRVGERADILNATQEGMGAKIAANVETALSEKVPSLDPSKSANAKAAGIAVDFAEKLKTAENYSEALNMIDNFKADIAQKAKAEGLDKNAPILQAAKNAADSAAQGIAKDLGAGAEIGDLLAANKAFSRNARLYDITKNSFISGEFSPKKFSQKWNEVKGSKAITESLTPEQITAIDKMIGKPGILAELVTGISNRVIPETARNLLPPILTKKPGIQFRSPSKTMEINPFIPSGAGVTGGLREAYNNAYKREE